MKVLIIGCGVIGTIYGWALSEAKHDVTHFVRKNKIANLSNGIDLDIYDLREEGERSVTDQLTMSLLDATGRGSIVSDLESIVNLAGSHHKRPKEQLKTYHPKLIDTLSNNNDELVIVPTKHTQLIDTLKQIYPKLKNSLFLIFCGYWGELEEIDALISRDQYILGYASSSGGYENDKMVVNIRRDYRIGSVDCSHSELLKKIITLFASADFVPDIKDNMLEWLWVHHAINGGTIGSMIYADGFDSIACNDAEFAKIFHAATLEAIDVLKKRGVSVEKYPDVQVFLKQTPIQVLENYRKLFVDTPIGQRVMRAGHHKHSLNEMRQYYLDVLLMGQKLGVLMPTLESYKNEIMKKF